ncbi:MAG: 16S rRNA processing protein RimM [Opitutaceae bacterium]|nr:16S rRNA processing protein RimM [Cytophagales bacterium]
MLKHADYFHLGKIVRTHGLTGNMICVLDTDRPEAYLKLESLFLEKNSSFLPYFIKKLILKGPEAHLTLEGIDSAEKAAALKGSDIYLPLSKLPKRGKNEFFIHDLLGCKLVDDLHGEMGLVEDIIETAGQDLISFTYKGAEVLLPFVKEFVTDIDMATKIVKTSLPDGLLEIYTSTIKQEKDDAFEETEGE